MTDAQRLALLQVLAPLVQTLTLAALLVFYRLKKRFKTARNETWKEVLDSNVVELLFAFLMLPGLWQAVYRGILEAIK